MSGSGTRVLFIYKKSAYQIYVRERKNGRVKDLIDRGDRTVQNVLSADQDHVETLEEAVKLMAGGGIDNPNKDPLLNVKHELSDEEVKQLVAFLKSLDGNVPFEAPTLPK